jgi:hypothetical protein
MIASAKDDYMNANIDLQRPSVSDDPKIMFQPLDVKKMQADNNNNETFNTASNHGIFETEKDAKGQPIMSTLVSTIIGNTNDITSNRAIKKYVIVNGFDRDWRNEKKRCNWSIDFATAATPSRNNFKNIHFIKFTSIIIPNEIIEPKSMVNQPKFVYHHDHKLAYPYLLLHVDEIDDVCDGINRQVQRSAAQFVYDTSYKCPNGRGYIIMKASQNETKEYIPQSLAVLRKLTFSIIKPSGALFNNSLDNYNIVQIDNEPLNHLYIQIVLDKYFDKNEFYVGDTIIIQDYKLFTDPDATMLELPEDRSANGYSMANFVNRSEGHEVIRIGDANDSGFYRSFYVMGPGILNQQQGRLEPQKCLLDTLKTTNAAVARFNIANGNNMMLTTNGRILNMSLQTTVNMTVGMEEHSISKPV